MPKAVMTIDEAFSTAVGLHRQNRTAEAKAACEQIIASFPGHVGALTLLGSLFSAAGNDSAAVGFFDRAIAAGPTAELLYHRGSSLLKLGLIDGAVADFDRSTKMRPGFPEGLYGLGIALRAAMRFSESVDAFRAAAKARPGWADAHNALGVSLKSLGRLADAEAAYAVALSARPDHVEALMNIGNVRRERADTAGAVESYRKAAAVNPASAVVRNALGLGLFDAGYPEDAAAEYRRAIDVDPAFADARNNLGMVLMALARTSGRAGSRAAAQSEAIGQFREAVRLSPRQVQYQINLGNALTESGQPAAALPVLETAVVLSPEFAAAWAALGLAHSDMGRPDLAIPAHQRALAIDPDQFDANANASIAYLATGDAGAAESTARRAIAAKPGDAASWSNLANALLEQGRTVDAIDAARRAVELDPAAADLHNNFVLDLHYLPGTDAARLRCEAEAWAAIHAPGNFQPPPTWHVRGNDPIVRIGYVSADFTRHAVGRFILPVIERHDRSRFQIHCFSNTPRGDDWTGRFRLQADRWHEVRPLDDDRLADLIRSQNIDLLIDLSVHTAGNRLPVFSRRPAPVQVTYLGYCGTSGISQIDYAIADARLAPPAEAIAAFTERVALLPDTYWCYRPPDHLPPVRPRVRTDTDPFTFGCLNNFAKMNQTVLETWAEILRAAQSSSLLIFAKRGPHRQATVDRFTAAGIAADRVRFVDPAPLSSFLLNYEKIDLALDPFPFNGGTSTCDALWMGVPVITFPGQTVVGRAGTSVLHAAGLPELIAADLPAYVRLAVELADSPSRVDAFRSTIRDRLATSALTDEPRFVRSLEALYGRIIRPDRPSDL